MPDTANDFILARPVDTYPVCYSGNVSAVWLAGIGPAVTIPWLHKRDGDSEFNQVVEYRVTVEPMLGVGQKLFVLDNDNTPGVYMDGYSFHLGLTLRFSADLRLAAQNSAVTYYCLATYRKPLSR